MADRVEILRRGIEKTDRIIEIGASFSPLAPKREGWHCFTVDHADREGLIEKYRQDPSANVAMIEPVDFVWTEGVLSGAIPVEHHGTFDVLLASHVIEHIPDLVSFLQSAEVLVRADGRMVFAIPDKRVCFDFFRPLTTTGDLLAAHWERRARHVPKALWDYFAYQVTKHGAPGWSRSDQATPALTYTLEQAFAWTRSHDSGAYIDAHSSTFVPTSFALIMLELARLGLTDWRIERTEVADCTEFYVWLRRGALAKATAMSQPEIAAERLSLLDRIMSELDDQGRQLVSSRANSLEHDLACAMEAVGQRQQADAGWVARLEQTQLELTNARKKIETMRSNRASRARAGLRRLLGLLAALSDPIPNRSTPDKLMIPFQLHRRIPLLRRPFFQRDQAIRERDALSAQLAATQAELERAASRSMIRNDPVETAPSPTQAKISDSVALMSDNPLLRFEQRLPSNQTAVDAFRGRWASDLQPLLGVTGTGTVPLFTHDRRPQQAATILGRDGKLSGFNVLELGPLEGAHSCLLEGLDVASVTAIESNVEAYLKCLVIKEVLGLKRCRFLLGDIVEYLAAVTYRQFDLIFCSGVLYHMADPLTLIRLICSVTDRCFIWTHYYDEQRHPLPFRAQSHFDASFAATYWSHTYGDRSSQFWGGNKQTAVWLESDTLLKAFCHFGLADITVIQDERDHPNGPCITFTARRPE